MSKYSDPSRNGSIFTLECIDSPHIQRVTSSTLLVDLRKSQRFNTWSPAELSTEDGEKFPCIMTNISRTGLQLVCEQNIKSVLHTGMRSLLKRKASTVVISFSLPGNISHKNPVIAICKPIYANKIKHGITQVGVKFISFKEGEEVLFDYLTLRELTD